MIRIELPFDILEAFSVDFFSRQNIGLTRIALNSAFVFFRLEDYDFGFVSAFGLRKINDQFTEFAFSGVELEFKKEDIYNLLISYQAAHKALLPLEYEEIFQKLGANIKAEDLDFTAMIDIAGKEIARQIYNKRIRIFNELSTNFVQKLKKDYPYQFAQTGIVNTIPPEVTDFPQVEVNKNYQTETVKEPANEPWKIIPDRGHDQEIIQLWRSGMTGREIGLKLSLVPGWVHARISQLRKMYPQASIPFHRLKKK